MELPVQVNGKLRDKITRPRRRRRGDDPARPPRRPRSVQPWLEGKTIKKRLYVPKKLVNFVVG